MRVLVLGGTVFLGRAVVEAALDRGHRITLFNRGLHSPELFPGVEKLRGDRNVDLGALRGRTFDAVIDTSGYRPEQVLAVADALGPGLAHYLFISSVSVYRTFRPGSTFDEDALVAEGTEGYGPAKARSEEALLAALPGRTSCVRPGLIVGPHDPTDRFTYWPRRVAQGGQVLAPGRPGRFVQFIDVRDLGEWCVRLVEGRGIGVFNAVGPGSPVTMQQLLEACLTVTDGGAEFIWVPDAELIEAGVKPWSELPLWIPEDDPDFGGMLRADNQRAIAAGLTFRPVADTIRATLDWDRTEGKPLSPSSLRVTPLSREREAATIGRVVA